MSTDDLTIMETSPETILKSVNAWLTGHFLLTSGLHSNEYMQCQKVMQYPRYGLQLARLLVGHLRKQNLIPTSVIGPALGAVHWEVFVATALDEALEPEEPIRALFAEKIAAADGTTQFELRRGLTFKPGEKVLVVEDVTTTGGSARKVVDLVRKCGAEPIAVGAIVDRSGGAVDFGIPFVKLIPLKIQNWEANDCQLCKDGLPIDKPGSKTAGSAGV